jgi:hypothetical protein
MPTATVKSRARRVSLWRRPLLVGFCVALGYGLTQRVLDLRLPGFVQWGQSFDVREMPGTGLESLRLRFGSEAHDLRGRLDLQPLATPPATTAEDPPLPTEVPPAQEPQQGPSAGQHSQGPIQGGPPAPQLPPPAPIQP